MHVCTVNLFLRFLTNSLPTGRRLRSARIPLPPHPRRPTLAHTDECHLCHSPGAQDDVRHIFGSCPPVRAALLAAALRCRITLPDATTLTLTTLTYPTDGWERTRVVECARLLLAFLAAVWRERRDFFSGLPLVPDARSVTQRITERILDSIPPARGKRPTPEAVLKLANNPPPTAVVGFSDGSALGNPGPAGAGALLILPHMRGRVHDSIALGDGDNNAGEIEGLLRVLELYLEARRRGHTEGATALLLFTDSLLVLGALEWGWSLTNMPPRIRALRALYLQVKTHTTVRLYWVRGHTGVVHNETVDDLAKQGAAHARDTNGPFPSHNTQWQVH